MKDHREIGRELELFFFHEFAPGAVFWLPKGWIIYKTLADFIRSKIESEGYQEISTPVMVKNQLFKQSGHWEHFGEHNMFNLAIYEEDDEELFHRNFEQAEKEGKVKVYKIDGTPTIFPVANYSLKPMNCPEAALVFKSKTRSYQELPIRLSEFGILHRRELSGVLGGLLRVRQFTIDDAHIFVRPDQIQQEISQLLKLLIKVYKSLGFNPKFYLATKPDKALGDAQTWKEAEEDLEKALKNANVQFDLKPKDGAFYGPKIDIHINDSQDRDWQLATIQLDFQIPQKMDIAYIDKDGNKKRPVMIHRGLTGSLERFIGILTEHFQGAFPLWLSPIQTIVLPISDKFLDYAGKVKNSLSEAGIRTDLDQRSETLQAKIRDATLQKIPYILVVGEKEEKNQNVAVRTRSGQDLKNMTLKDITDKIIKEIATKS